MVLLPDCSLWVHNVYNTNSIDKDILFREIVRNMGNGRDILGLKTMLTRKDTEIAAKRSEDLYIKLLKIGNSHLDQSLKIQQLYRENSPPSLSSICSVLPWIRKIINIQHLISEFFRQKHADNIYPYFRLSCPKEFITLIDGFLCIMCFVNR